MEQCREKCRPMCDFCKWAKHGDFEKDGTSWPIGCKKSPEEKYQEIARKNGYCPEFQCHAAKEDT